MNIDEVIESVKIQKQGYDIDEADIIRWINDVEMMIIDEIAKGREGEEELAENYGGYTANVDRAHELIAAPPYSGMYAQYACSLIELRNQNSELYEAHTTVFNSLLDGFKRFYYKKHRQKRNYPYHF